MRHTRLIVQTLVVAAGCVYSYAAVQEARTYQEDPLHRAAEAPLPARSLLLREGTEVTLKFAQKLSGKSTFVGEPVELVLAQDLKVGDAVVAKQGARVLGTVVAGKESEKKRKEARELAMRVDFLKAGNKKIKLRGEKAAEGKRNKNAMVEGTVFLGLSGLLMTSGKHYEIPEGSLVTAYVDEDVELQAVNP
jgi:hypothetical protein